MFFLYFNAKRQMKLDILLQFYLKYTILKKKL